MQLLKSKLKLTKIPIEKIKANPAQPRKVFNKEEIDELSRSIKENGLLQPIVVRKEDKHYYLIAGERRLRACKQAGMYEIDAIINNMCQEDSAILAIIENLQRKDLNMFEEANGIANLLREWNITQENAAKRLGMSQSALANKVRLLKFDTEEQEEILNNNLTERHARALLRINDMILRQKVMSVIIKKKLNVSQSEELIETYLERKDNKKNPMRTFIAKDIRLFINTINHAVDAMKTAGIEAESEKKETDEYIECTVRIPKINRV